MEGSPERNAPGAKDSEELQVEYLGLSLCQFLCFNNFFDIFSECPMSSEGFLFNLGGSGLVFGQEIVFSRTAQKLARFTRGGLDQSMS